VISAFISEGQQQIAKSQVIPNDDVVSGDAAEGLNSWASLFRKEQQHGDTHTLDPDCSLRCWGCGNTG
jgi:hypothetical protein